MANIALLVRLRDEASRGLQRIVDRTKALANTNVTLAGTFRVVTTAAAALTAAAVGTVAGLGALAKRGAEVIGVQNAFARVVGDSQGALRGLRQASQGLISDYELMTGLNRALTLGSAATADEFGQLARTAIALGRALGVDAAFALESLNLGIGRQSRLILDNLGLIVSVEKANERYANALGIAANQLTDVQQREAFRTAVLEQARRKIEELGGFSETAGDKVQRLGVAFKNARDRISELVATSPAVNRLFEGLASFGTQIATILHGSGDQIRTVFEQLGIIAGNAFSKAVIESTRGVLNFFTPRGFTQAPPGRGEGHPGQARGPVTAEEASLLVRTSEQASTNIRDAFAVIADVAADVSDQLARGTAGRAPVDVAEAAKLEAGLRSRFGIAVIPGTLGGLRARSEFGHTVIERQFPAEVPEIGVRGGSLQRGARSRDIGISFQSFGLRESQRFGELPSIVSDEIVDKTTKLTDTVVEQFGFMAESGIRSSEQLASAAVSAFARILQSIPGVAAGPFGAFIGPLAGIVGALASRPTPVRVDSYSDQALNQRQERRGEPDDVVFQIVLNGQVIAEAITPDIMYASRRRTALDAEPRLPR